MFICICNAITERQVQEAVAQGADTMGALQGQLGVGTCCGCCSDTAAEYLPGGRYASENVLRSAQATPVEAAANDTGLGGMVEVAIRRA
ncbi:hypothetical protein GSY71_04760 [Pusillimonas sp. TS35]|uniref:(2Fe-2S)-binding protein n=1 Tax=Paracandidimonas lactea TaxID=2895524 RepID=UPI001369285D|nr:(2Fe-2S)-binding protein [Paracandidimonas lactea]MYN12461.1 hypothetical protein [Pusillimonas sp. TS35]